MIDIVDWSYVGKYAKLLSAVLEETDKAFATEEGANNYEKVMKFISAASKHSTKSAKQESLVASLAQESLRPNSLRLQQERMLL